MVSNLLGIADVGTEESVLDEDLVKVRLVLKTGAPVIEGTIGATAVTIETLIVPGTVMVVIGTGATLIEVLAVAVTSTFVRASRIARLRESRGGSPIRANPSNKARRSRHVA